MRPRTLTTFALFAALGALATFAPACTQSLDDGMDDGELVGGDASGPEDDAVVLLVREGKPLCTATLVAPNVLLTAHHCVGRVRVAGTGTAPASGQGDIVPYQPAEISIRLGGTPGDKAAAIATKIYTPRAATTTTADSPPLDGGVGDGGTGAATVPRSLEGADIAAILVQPLDPAFDRLRPRKMRDTSISETDGVTVVGWSGNGTEMRLGTIKRMKRTTVDVLADATQRVQVQSPSLEGIAATNKPREFITEAVACTGDDGAPAFDADGSLAGFAVAVVGPCAAGSLSVFTDSASHKAFVQSVLGEIQRLQCSTDSKCGTAGRICDTATFTCVEGCRTGSVQCASGLRCSNPSELTPGVAGQCSTSGGTTTPPLTDGGYTPPFTDEDGGYTTPVTPPLGDGGTAGGSSCSDRTCGGTTTAPKVCLRNQCVEGCRVGATPGMCQAGYECKAGTDDPTAGKCEARAAVAPPPPSVALPSRPNETIGDTPPGGNDPGGGSTGSTDGGKKSKNKAKKDEGGCSIGAAPTGGVSSAALAWLASALGLVAVRRRRR